MDFQERQRLVRELVENSIREASDKSGGLFKAGIERILADLRAKIHKQDEIDQN